MVCAVFGYYPKSVKAYRNGENITVVFRYENYDVIGLFTEHSRYYSVSVFFQETTVSPDTEIGNACFAREFEEFYRLLQGGAQEISYQDFIAPVFILNAIDRSLTSGEEEIVTSYEV